MNIGEWFCGYQEMIYDRPHLNCPECGNPDMNYEIDPENCAFDGELAELWGWQVKPEPDTWHTANFMVPLTDQHGKPIDPDHPAYRFMYTYRMETCGSSGVEDDDEGNLVVWDCGWQAYVGPRRYWNPQTGQFDTSKPYTPLEQARIDRAELIDAGQMRLLP